MKGRFADDTTAFNLKHHNKTKAGDDSAIGRFKAMCNALKNAGQIDDAMADTLLGQLFDLKIKAVHRQTELA